MVRVWPRSRAGSTKAASTSRTGLASSTAGSRAMTSRTPSSKPSRGPLMDASACPVTLRTAEENSARAEALIRCTA